MRYTTTIYDSHPVVTLGNAGIDLRYMGPLEEVIFQPLERKLLHTPWAFEIPMGHVGFVCSRSGLANSQGLMVLNAPGVIDPSYRGTIGVLLINLSTTPQSIVKGERIAQLVIVMQVETIELEHVNELPLTSRNEQGFGSTGRF